MKQLAFVIFMLVGVVTIMAKMNDNPNASVVDQRVTNSDTTHHDIEDNNTILDQAFSNHESNIQVYGEGIVIKLLPDDNDGSRHQKFIVKLASGQTVLIAHNIDLAPRINSLQRGDFIKFYGEYEWNDKGGLIHWTHRDPDGYHEAGWLEHQDRRYQ